MPQSISKAEEVATTLRTEILQGQYRPGERLPSERDLATRFQANRGAIREAIKKLEQLGIASVTPGGVRVVPVEEATLEVLGHLIDLEDRPGIDLIGQVLDVIGAMMSLSARSAVAQASDEQLEEIHRLIREIIDTSDNEEARHSNWAELGECFVSIHNNLVLRLVFNGLRTQFVDRMMQYREQPPVELQYETDELEKLAQAVQERKTNQVGIALINHFQIMKKKMIEVAQQMNPEEQRSAVHG